MKKKILFVEDEPDQQYIVNLKEKLEEMGYKIDIAPNTLDAYSVLIYDKNRLNYDLVLLDLMMPSGYLGNEYQNYRGFGGFCMIEELKKNKIEVNILVYTHIKDDTIEQLIKDKGIKVIYKKPATAMSDGLEDIVGEIQKVLKI